jgi:hypothetical protein
LAEELQAHHAQGDKSAQVEKKAREWQQQAQASARQVSVGADNICEERGVRVRPSFVSSLPLSRSYRVFLM